MYRRFHSICFALLACGWLVGAFCVSAQPLKLSVAGAGADAKTLVIYTGTHTPYSLADDLAALNLQLRRVATDLKAVPAVQADPQSIAEADYVVLFCPQPFPELSDAQLQAITNRQKPVLWVGYGADELETMPSFAGQFKTATFASAQPATRVIYQGHEWDEPVSFWIPTQISATNGATVIMSAVVEGDTNSAPQPFAWKSGQVTFYAALPVLTANCSLFSDMLLDFYDADVTGPSVVGIRIDGYHCRQDHMEFRNLVKLLAEHKRPFIVGVIPAYYDVIKDRVLDLDYQAEFVAALRFAQQNGGRLVMQGYMLGGKGRSPYAAEFWDSNADSPLPGDSAEYVRERIEKGLEQMFAKGLFPYAWVTPRYSASRQDYAEFAKFFSTAIERVQLSETTALESFAGSACSTDEFGRFIIPENLGLATGGRSALVRLYDRTMHLTQLRGTTAVCYFPAYFTDNKLAQVLTALEQSHAPFFDLADGDNWVQTSDLVMLTGKARHAVDLNNARVRWRAYDRAGKLLDEEVEAATFTGRRIFERRGKGDIEIFQFNQGKS